MEGHRKCTVSRINNQRGRKVRRWKVGSPARHQATLPPAHWLPAPPPPWQPHSSRRPIRAWRERKKKERGERPVAGEEDEKNTTEWKNNCSVINQAAKTWERTLQARARRGEWATDERKVSLSGSIFMGLDVSVRRLGVSPCPPLPPPTPPPQIYRENERILQKMCLKTG